MYHCLLFDLKITSNEHKNGIKSNKRSTSRGTLPEGEIWHFQIPNYAHLLPETAHGNLLCDHDGLLIEVLPTGGKMAFPLPLTTNRNGSRWANTQLSLLKHWLWREKCRRSLVAHGINPAQKNAEEKLKHKD